MSKKLAIKGHSTRGKEVIELLEMMGGDNIYSHWNGDQENMRYFINEQGNIDNGYLMANCNNYEVFTLEEFLEKYPFKIGDIVIDRLEESKGIYELELMKLENKRLDIINMTSAPNSSIVLSDFNINDLTSEFKEKIEIKNINAEVNTIMSTEVESEESTISNEEINSYYDLL